MTTQEQPLPGTNNSIGQSEFTYEHPDTAPDPAFDQEARDTIAAIAAEFEGEPAEVDPDAPGEETEDPGDVLAPTEGTKDEKEDPRLERGVARLVSRELAAKEQEAKASARITELKALEAEVASLRGLKSAKEQQERMAQDPIGVMKDWGHDPEVIIRLALAQQLEATGQPVPEKLQKFVERSATQRELTQLRAQIASQEQARRSQDYFNTVSNGAREYVRSVGDSTPTVARAAKANPDRVHREIMDEIVRDSNTRAASDPNGDPLSYDAAAKLVETRWVELQKLLGGTAAVQNGKSAPTNAVKPKLAPPQTKPPAKPLASWMKGSEKTLEDEGIEEAMRAFANAETQRKQRRS